MRTEPEGVCLPARKRDFTRNWISQHHNLRLLATRTLRNVLFKPPCLWYFIMADRANEKKIIPVRFNTILPLELTIRIQHQGNLELLPSFRIIFSLVSKAPSLLVIWVLVSGLEPLSRLLVQDSIASRLGSNLAFFTSLWSFCLLPSGPCCLQPGLFHGDHLLASLSSYVSASDSPSQTLLPLFQVTAHWL